MQVQHMLQMLDSTLTWGFDVFEFEHACSEACGAADARPASLLTYALLDRHHVIDSLGIDRSTLLKWLSAIEAQYNCDNAYHNALHAADVVASLHYFMQLPNLQRQLQPLDVLSGLLAALTHDAGHQGINNKFLEVAIAEIIRDINAVIITEIAAGIIIEIIAESTPCVGDPERAGDHVQRRLHPRAPPRGDRVPAAAQRGVRLDVGVERRAVPRLPRVGDHDGSRNGHEGALRQFEQVQVEDGGRRLRRRAARAEGTPTYFATSKSV